MKLKQFISFAIAILIMGIITALTGAAANKNLSIRWYIVWIIITAIVLHFDIMWLDKLINDGEWI